MTSSPLVRFADRLPSHDELAAMTPTELAALLTAAEDMGEVGPVDMRDLRCWGQQVADCVRSELTRRVR